MSDSTNIKIKQVRQLTKFWFYKGSKLIKGRKYVYEGKTYYD